MLLFVLMSLFVSHLYLICFRKFVTCVFNNNTVKARATAQGVAVRLCGVFSKIKIYNLNRKIGKHKQQKGFLNLIYRIDRSSLILEKTARKHTATPCAVARAFTVINIFR